MMLSTTAGHGIEDTATSTPKLPQKVMSRKRLRTDTSDALPAQKKVATSRLGDEEMADVEPFSTAMDVDPPCTQAASRRKKVQKGSRQNRKPWR